MKAVAPTLPEEVLRFQDVRKSYGGVPVLKGVSLCIRRAELVGLLGPNGAGKSTLFQIASGLFAADEGQVEVFGLTYREAASSILARLGVVFQSRSLDLDITARANLKFHGGLFGLFGRGLRTRIDEVAEMMDIADLLDQPVRKLSGGNQRRVEIARALLSAPELLLLDEPSTGLDAAARRNLVAHMQAIVRDHAISVLWATHLVDEVAEADRIVLLVAGAVARDACPADLVAQSGARDLTGAYIALTGAKPAVV
jgi:ABC-2 type transport system ATP-binding protein